MNNKYTFQQKIKVLGKVIEAGHNTEKKLAQLSIEDILKIPNITILEINIITEIQKSVKSKSLITYLGNGDDEQPQSKGDKNEL